jgi:hypothetical protein
VWSWRLFWLGVAIILLIVLASCGEEADVETPKWRYSCLESVKITQMKPLKVGDVTTLELVTTTVCIRSEMKCTWGRNFKGIKRCEPRETA